MDKDYEHELETTNIRHRRNYHKRKELGLCPHCGKPRDGETLSCSKCKNYNNTYLKETYDYFKSKGICVYCKTQKARQGKISCLECAGKQAERRAIKPRVYTEEQKEKAKARERALYAQRRANGLCTECGKPVYKNPYTTMYCYEHFVKSRRKNLKRTVYNLGKKYMDIGEQP